MGQEDVALAWIEIFWLPVFVFYKMMHIIAHPSSKPFQKRFAVKRREEPFHHFKKSDVTIDIF